MSVKVTVFDIREGEPRADVGVYESIQMTGDTLRDPNGDTILYRDTHEGWVVAADGSEWYDWTVEAAW